jgi:ABC-type nitrate/sulfonate/bicarbonate transport system permease component
MTNRLRLVVLELILPCALVASWWISSAGSTSPYFPPLSENLQRLVDMWFSDRLGSDVLPSLRHFAIGFAIAVVVGVLLGTLLGLSPRCRRDLLPITEFFRAMPIAALAPAALVLFGSSPTMEIVLIAFGSCWPILVSTTDGVRGVDPVLLETARIYGLSRRRRIIAVTMPAASPQIFSGLRISLSIGLAITIIASMFSGPGGLGFVILESQRTFDIAGMWAGIFLLGLVGYLVNGLLALVESRALAWHRGARAGAGAA